MPDFIALRGDPSDKIPGARGVGASGAADLLKRYGSLKAILAAGRFKTEAKELRLYRSIATMDAKAPLPRIRRSKAELGQSRCAGEQVAAEPIIQAVGRHVLRCHVLGSHHETSWSKSLTATAPAPCEEGAIRATAIAGNCGPSAKTWVLAGTILASAIAYVDESVVNIALPAIEKNLSASVAVIQWLINAYTLCLAALLLIGGAAADRYGRRRMFIIGVSIFAAASLVCGIAPDVTVLISARAIQGVGAALLIPCSLALIGASFDEAERGKAIGTWAGFSAISAAIGPILGGWIVDGFSWRWIFLINPLLALPALWIAYRHVPESVNPRSGALDWPGALLVLVALVGICFGLIVAPSLGWADARVLASLAGGSIFGAAFLWQEAHSGAPMLPLYLFRSRTFSSVNLLTFLLYAALAAAFFFLPFALIQVHGYSALAHRRGVSSVHRHHERAVALVGRFARPVRRATAAGRRAWSRGDRIWSAVFRRA